MKKFFAILISALLLVMVPIAVSADNGVSIGNRSYTLPFSGASYTVLASNGTATTTAVTFDNPMNSIACDFLSSSASATGTVYFEGNAGSSSTSFAPANLFSTVKAAGTFTTIWIPTGKPVRILRATFTTIVNAPSNSIQINCFGAQF